MLKKYRSDIIFFSLLIIFIVIFYFLAVVVLPFFLGLAFAFIINPAIKRIQKIFPNRNLAVSAFLISVFILFIVTIVLFAGQINNDFKRLNNAFRTYADSNKELIDDTSQRIKSWLENIYSPEELKEQLGLNQNTDSITNKDELFSELDIETIKESLSAIASFFYSKDEADSDSDSRLNWFIIIISSFLYFIYIIYTFNYFDNIIQKYLKNKQSEKFSRIISDLRSTFLNYFKERTKIVLIYTVVFTASFFIIGIPGALILGVITGFLCYIPYFQYLTLIPISLSCLVLSMEDSSGFFLSFGIIFAIFVVMSVIEELLLFPKIMKGVSGMNPAIMMVSVAVWGYLLGILGIFIALPLTSLIMSYVKQVLLYGKNETKAGF